LQEGRLEVLGRDLSHLSASELVRVRREIGFIFQMHNLFEALSAVAAFVPAWLLCLVVYQVVGEFALLPLRMTLTQTALSFALTLGMCLVSAALAVRRVVSVDPAEVF
jgi:ABC-type ATPase involved in cell division